MASFQAKIDWKRWRNGENKNCLSVPFVLEGKYKIPNNEKKIGWKMPRKRKQRKEKMSFRFVHTQRVIENSKKNSKKFQKIKKPCYGFFSSQNRLEKAEKERK